MFWSIFGFCIEVLCFTVIIMSFQTSVLLGGGLFLLWLFMYPGSITNFFIELDELGKGRATGSEVNLSTPSPLLNLVGKEGKTVSVMRPEGTVKVNGERYLAKTYLGFMAADLPIRVIDARNKTLIVEELISDTYETIQM